MAQDISQTTQVVLRLTTLEEGKRDLHSTWKAIMETEINRTTMQVISTISLVEYKLTAMDSLNTIILEEVHPITLVVLKIITMAQDISQTTQVVLRLTTLEEGKRDLHSACKAIKETEFNQTTMEVIILISLVEYNLTTMNSLNTTLLAEVHPIITMAQDISQTT